jgi:hypothetical protein
MDETSKAIVHKAVVELKKRAKEGTIFGYPVNEQDTEQLIFAAYLMGQVDQATTDMLNRQKEVKP